MSFKSFKGYVLTILSGAVLLAVVVLVTLQWGQRASFSLYGKPYDLHLVEGRITGGVNTSLLMLLSGLGALVVVAMGWVLVYGIRVLLNSRRRQALHKVQQRVEKLEQPTGQTPAE